MSNENMDVSDIVKKSKILLLDIEGTTTSISFVKNRLFPYAEEKVKTFLEEQWDQDHVKEVVSELRKLALEDKENDVDGVVSIPGEDSPKEEQIEALVKSVKWQMSQDRKVAPLKQLQGLIWKQGYDSGDIKGHVYDDVSPALEQWQSVNEQKVYIYSSGSVQAQKLLFGQSLAGDMLRFIDGHFDTAVGPKQDTASYAAIAEKVGCKPDEILFLTDIVKEAEAARAAGLHAALVSREGNEPLPEEATAAYPVIKSFSQLTPQSNKRKTEDQPSQDELPAKVQKTDTEMDVKSSVESQTVETKDSTEDVTEKSDAKDTEKMEVEMNNEQNGCTETVESEQLAVRVETTVEEITDMKEVTDAAICKSIPIVEEKMEEDGEKTEEKETEKIDSEPNIMIEDVSEITNSNEINNEEKNVMAEETPPVVVEEIATEKESLDKVGEIFEDLQPVVEEPSAGEDIEVLKNVGEVLEKECDEILSRVQEVTNLDSIPVKTLLNTITEETMDTENLDSNSIVERILDTELDLEMKQCAEIDLNTAIESETLALNENNEDITLGTKVTDGVDSDKNLPSENKDDMKCNELETIADQTETKCIESTNVKEQSIETIIKDSPVDSTSDSSKLNETEPEPMEVVLETTETVSNTREISPQKEMTKEASKQTEAVALESTEVSAEAKDKCSQEKDISEVNEIKVDNETSKGNEMQSESKDVSETKAISSEPNELSQETKEIRSETKEILPETKEIRPDTKEILPEIKEVRPETKEIRPDTKEILPEIKEVRPETKEVQPETNDIKDTLEAKESEVNDTDMEEVKEPVLESQVNGNTTNGDISLVVNGDASKTEELSARLSVENGNGESVVNGSNGKPELTEQGQGDAKAEIVDIKVKTVATDEPRTDPVEQPTEA